RDRLQRRRRGGRVDRGPRRAGPRAQLRGGGAAQTVPVGGPREPLAALARGPRGQAHGPCGELTPAERLHLPTHRRVAGERWSGRLHGVRDVAPRGRDGYGRGGGAHGQGGRGRRSHVTSFRGRGGPWVACG